jgi:outer membrane protein assembly factor BamB
VFGNPVGPPIVVDLSGGGEREVLCLTDTGVLSAHGPGGKLLFAWETGHRYRAPASAGDIDGDGGTEITLLDVDGTLRVYDARTRREKWSFESGEGISVGRVAIAYCDGRKGLEVVFATVSGALYVIDGQSGAILGVHNCNGYTFSAPLIADLNADRINEILISAYRGEVFSLQLADARKPFLRLRKSAWASLHHDYFNRGTSRPYFSLLGKR